VYFKNFRFTDNQNETELDMLLAPMNEPFESRDGSSLTPRGVGTIFAYDAAMDAYKYSAKGGWNAYNAIIGGSVSARYNSGRYTATNNNGYKEVAIDIYFSGKLTASDTLLIGLSNTQKTESTVQRLNATAANQCPPIIIYAANDPNKTPLMFDDIRENEGVWYTVVFEAGEIIDGGNYGGIPISLHGASFYSDGASLMDVYFRNFRFI